MERPAAPKRNADTVPRRSAKETGLLVQNAILEDSMLEDFWFRRPIYGSDRLFGAKPIVVQKSRLNHN